MCQLAKRLLAEKLIEDFYDGYESVRTHENAENFMERLKAVLPTEEHELLERWETANAERCGAELRQFADYVSGVLMTAERHEKDDEIQSSLDHEVKCIW